KWLGRVVSRLDGSAVLPITVVGFPGGRESTAEKADQTRQAIEAGAREIDMVLNRDLLRAGDGSEAERDSRAVVEQAGAIPVKVILETSELSDTEKRLACRLAQAAGARFVKTSTGFASGGATEADVRLMRDTVGSTMGVKASGGIRTREAALRM